jgi:hypothetical protein
MAGVAAPESVIERYLPSFDVAITEHLVVDAETAAAYEAARELDFMTVRSPLLAASFFVRGLPARVCGRAVDAPPQLRLADRSAGLPGWLYLGDIPGLEVAFGAVGKFWKPVIEWRNVAVEDFASFAEPGWGKIACHFVVRPSDSGRAAITYECRTATTDGEARREMERYWWLIRPFVSHIMRATLRTIRDDTSVASRAPI